MACVDSHRPLQGPSGWKRPRVTAIAFHGYDAAQPDCPIEKEAKRNAARACCEQLDEPLKEDKFSGEGFGNSKKGQVGIAKSIDKKHDPFEIARDNKARQERDMNYLAGQNTRLKGDISKLKADMELLKQKLGISQEESAQAVEAQKAADARYANIITRKMLRHGKKKILGYQKLEQKDDLSEADVAKLKELKVADLSEKHHISETAAKQLLNMTSQPQKEMRDHAHPSIDKAMCQQALDLAAWPLWQVQALQEILDMLDSDLD